jgi:hypothetical protein
MNVRLKYSVAFTAGVFYNNQMRMNNYRVVLDLVTISDGSNDDHNIALERIKYFIHNQLDSTIFINRAYESQCQQYMSAGLNVTTLPEEPVDQVIGIMLYSKLNAIMEDRMIVTHIEVSSEMGDNISYMHSDDEHLGPFDSTGWWAESDVVHCDSALIDHSKVVALAQSACWRELNLQWEDTDIVTDVADDNKVLFADFKKDETR